MRPSSLIQQVAAEISQVSPNPSSDAALLIQFVTQKSSTELMQSADVSLAAAQQQLLAEAISQLQAEKPLAHITKATEFFDLPIKVASDTLIPRPETEGLVELALEHIDSTQKVDNSSIDILEVGLGTGCIACAISYQLRIKNINFEYFGIEKSPSALKVANINLQATDNLAKKRNLLPVTKPQKVITRQGQLTDNPDLAKKTWNLLISNPPYITRSEMKELANSVQDYEPHLALDGGEDGLDVYREIYSFTKQLAEPPVIMLEISPTIVEGIEKLFRDYQVEIKQDMYGRDRYAVIS